MKELSLIEKRELCNKADMLDPSVYKELCENDKLTEDEFFDKLIQLINLHN